MHPTPTNRRVVTDADLWKLATQQPTSKAAAMRLLRHAGCRANDDTALALLERAAEVKRQRSTRPMRRIVQRLGHEPVAAKRPATTTRPVVLGEGTPADRLAVLRVDAVEDAARRVLRYGAAGGHSMRVHVTRDPSDVGYTVTLGKNYTVYLGRFKGCAAGVDHHLIVVPEDWLTRVHRQGLATLGGMLTLDLHEMTTSETGPRLFAAVWARQGRGFQVAVERGYIAVREGESYHAETAEAAIRGLRRKEAAAVRLHR